MGIGQSYEFGPFLLEAQDRLLFREGERVPLTPKAFEILALLVEAQGGILTKEELLKRVWPDSFVEEGNLASNVSLLRKVLGETETSPYIETVPKRGYRFVAPLRAPPPEISASTAQRKSDDPRIGKPSPLSSHRPRVLLAVGVLLAVALGVLYYRRLQHNPAVQGKVMLAVLPFVNLTGDPTQEFVSDGLTEEMITQLGQLHRGGLGIIARTSAMAYKGTSKSISQIGRELGVEYVLEGSVRRWGDQVRISAQLIQTRDQTHVWAENFESDRRDILKLQSDVAQAIAQQISLQLTSEEKARVTSVSRVDPEVYELCLLGRYQWNKRTESAINKAIAYFQDAIRRNPNSAPAYAGLADSYAVLPYYSGASPSDAFRQAKTAAERALQLDETVVEAHVTLGLIAASGFDQATADREYNRAMELNPNYARTYHWYSFYLWNTDRHEQALTEIERARQLDPLSLIVLADEARLLCVSGQTDRAIELLQKAIQLDPTFAEAHRSLALAYLQKGQSAEAIAEARRGMELDPIGSQQATLGYVYARTGDKAQGLRILAELSTPGRKPPISPVYFSFIYAGLGQNDQAFACLEQAYRERSLLLEGLQSELIFDALRTDPRFVGLWHRVTQMRSNPGP